MSSASKIKTHINHFAVQASTNQKVNKRKKIVRFQSYRDISYMSLWNKVLNPMKFLWMPMGCMDV
jgi:hypothetical protein